jgi:hypothetical protein
MTADGAVTRMRLGPLRYELISQGEWGFAAVAELEHHLEVVPFDEAPHRTLRFMDLGWDEKARERARSGRLPQPLAAGLGDDHPREGWSRHDLPTGAGVWLTRGCDLGFVTPLLDESDWSPRYHFPWPAVVADAARLQAVVIHAALAVRDGRGWLVTAPPGGGKTTTVGHLPEEWVVLSDDAALLWSVGGALLASPLPTWSHMLGVSEPPRGVGLWRVAEHLPVGGALVVQKSDADELELLTPQAALGALYRALSEHPAMLDARLGMLDAVLGAATDVVAAGPCYELRLTRARLGLPELLAGLREP